MKYIKNYLLVSILLCLSVASVPATSMASYDDTLLLLNKLNIIQASSGDLLQKNQSLRDTLNTIYQNIIATLQDELDSINHSQTISVVLDPVLSPIERGSIVTINFVRTPKDSSSPINFFIENGNKAVVGSLSNQVVANNMKWQVADNFLIGKNYYISAKDKTGYLLGRSNVFQISAALVKVTSVSGVIPHNKTQSETVIPDINLGSIGYWSFDGDSNRCATRGGAMTNYAGKIGNALGLDGVSSFCVAQTSPTFYPKYFTLALWAKSDTANYNVWNSSDWFTSMLGKSGYSIGPVAGTKDVRFKILDDTTGVQQVYNLGVVTPTNISDWHHYAMTYDGLVANIYLDGLLVKSTPVEISRSGVGNYDLLFGSYNNGTNEQFGGGSLDEIRLYNRALPACEIQILAGKNCGGFSLDSSGRQIANVLSATHGLLNKLNSIIGR